MEWPLIGREPDLDHAVGLVESGTGVALLGTAGVGKSRLLHELGDRVERSGMSLVRAVAAGSTKVIPFAPFVELLPGVPTQDRLVMLREALDALHRRRSQRGLILAVDDAHLLDQESLAFVISVASSGAATIGLTARSGEPMASDLVDLWTNGVIERIDLDPLDRETSRSVAEARLGPIGDDLEEELWRLAEGNPLVLHELIEGAIGRALTRGEDGAWKRLGPLAESARLGDLVASRLNALPEDLRSAMELVAVGAPLPSDIFGSMLSDALPDLDSRGLISLIEEVGGRPAIIPSHPLYGEILQSNLDPGRLRSTHRRLVEASLAASHISDPLRVAVWQRDSGDLLDDELALAGAAEALVRHDPGLAEELVGAVGTEGDRAALLLGRALSYQQRFVEAEEVLGGRNPADEDLIGETASVRAQNLAFGLGRISEARRLLSEATTSIVDDQLRSRLNNERAMISAIEGDFVDAIAASEAVLGNHGSSDLARTSAYATLTVAQAMTGDCASLDAIIEEAAQLASQVREKLPFARDQIEIMHMQSLLNAGRLTEALDLAKARLNHDEFGAAMRSTWLSALGLTLDLLARHQQAVEAARMALELYADADPFGLEVQTRGLLALELGLQGLAEAGDPLKNLRLPSRAPRLTVWVDRGTAWAAVADGALENALDVLISGGRHAIAHEHFVWGAFCLHDVVRLGRADLVLEDLRQLPVMNGADLVENMREHAEAQVASDADGLAAVAATFVGMGAALLGAEAWSHAAMLRGEEEAKAALWVLLSAVSESSCEGSDTPALRDRPRLVTAREAEVATDAARGLSSSQIGEARFISVRTVDNHLRSVYRKLGIGGRDELAVLLRRAGRASTSNE
ncbi:MAG TPA: LuxR C-terminal-related transcriptional regulator [Acidimicrobiia bacterium]